MNQHLRTALEQLYAAPPDRFTSSRAQLVAQAKAAGDASAAKDIGALRKPTLSAWALNAFGREHADELDGLTRFAGLLREAQRTLDADRLRALGRERSRQVDDLTGRVVAAAGAAGQPLGPGAVQEVRDTLTALVADEEAERSVRTRALVRPLTYSGLGEVDLEDVVAHPAVAAPAPSAAPSAAPSPERQRERRRLAVALAEATRSREEAAARVEAIAARLEAVTAELEEARGIRRSREEDERRAQAALEAHDAVRG